MKPLIIIGRGGHALSCLDVLQATNQFEILGYVDHAPGTQWEGLRCLGTDEDLPRLAKECSNFFIAIGQIGGPGTRRSVVTKLKELGVNFPVVISPKAHVAQGAQLGEGTIVMHGAHVGPRVLAGSFNIFNTRSLIEHGCSLGHFIHVSTAAVVNGDVIIGDNSFLGSNSVLCHGIKVPADAFVQAGKFIGRKHAW